MDPALEPRPVETVRVLVICRVRLYNDAITGLLNRHPCIVAIGLTEVSDNMLTEVEAAAADVVLLDVGTPGALALAGSIVVARARTRILAIGVDEAPVHVVACAQAGLWGYVPCHVCSEAMAEKLFGHIRSAAHGDSVPAIDVLLTCRQRQILHLIDEGLSNKQIARQLSLGTSTVKNHVHSILGRLKVGRRTEAAARIPPDVLAVPRHAPLRP